MKRNTNIVLTLLMISLCTISSLYAQEKKGKLKVPPVIVIKNVHVWNGTSDTLQRNTDVLIVGDKIRKVAKNIPTAGTVEVDAVRKTMKRVADAPGLEGGSYNFNVKDDKGKVEKVSAKVTVIDGKGAISFPESSILTSTSCCRRKRDRRTS